MYVCVCNAIRECEFRHAARRVDGDAEAVYEALGKRPQCGSCLEDADMILAEERACSRRLRLVAA
jgi:bacterioferritin-associated ferredoxin